MNKKYQLILLILLLLWGVRETIFFETTRHTGSSTSEFRSLNSSGSTYSNPVNFNSSDVVIWPTPMDYIPFYKVRTFKGEVIIRDRDDSLAASTKLTYEINQKVVGLCSGRSFRQLARDQIIQKLKENKRLNFTNSISASN